MLGLLWDTGAGLRIHWGYGGGALEVGGMDTSSDEGGVDIMDTRRT